MVFESKGNVGCVTLYAGRWWCLRAARPLICIDYHFPWATWFIIKIADLQTVLKSLQFVAFYSLRFYMFTSYIMLLMIYFLPYPLHIQCLDLLPVIGMMSKLTLTFLNLISFFFQLPKHEVFLPCPFVPGTRTVRTPIFASRPGRWNESFIRASHPGWVGRRGRSCCLQYKLFYVT